MIKPLLSRLAPLLFLLVFTPAEIHAHGHLAASASGTTLLLLDAENGTMPGTNPETYHLVWRAAGTYPGSQYAGYYSFDQSPRDIYPEDYFSFTALSVDDNDQMLLGSKIWISMSLISGPTGGNFAFWEAGAMSPTHLFPSDGSGGSFDFVLSQWASAGVPDAAQDPWGHIHNRAFTADTPGDYYVQFSLYDSQGQLDPSSNYSFHFVAVPEPGTLTLGLLGAALLIGRKRIRK